MGRSKRDRGLGPVLLVLLVVAPLTFFAVLSLFEDASADSINLSLDGAQWAPTVQGALLASGDPWGPGEARSAIVYVKNSGPDPVDASVSVLAASTTDAVTDSYVTLTAQVDQQSPLDLPNDSEAHDVPVDGLGSDRIVPLTLTATIADTAPIGTTVDDADLRLTLTITGTRTEASGSPSLLDATGAQLWLAPILLVVSAAVALLVQARRRRRPTRS
jgi:hypothetical protein